MPLKRISGQPGDLKSFYRQLAEAGPQTRLSKVGHRMLELLPALDVMCQDKMIWAATSHATLCLLLRDDYQADCFAAIDVVSNEYEVTYPAQKVGDAASSTPLRVRLVTPEAVAEALSVRLARTS